MTTLCGFTENIIPFRSVLSLLLTALILSTNFYRESFGQKFFTHAPSPEPTASPTSSCNISYYKDVWLREIYSGPLSGDPTFWMYQSQSQVILDKGMALEFAYSKCKMKFDNLIRFKAGRSGPVDPQKTYSAMCSRLCMESDLLHNEAMTLSGCSCLELSTKSDDPSWTRDGDWCDHNTARILCNVIGFCGIWECRIDDFNCPRHEYNKRTIPLKGRGNCVRNTSSKSAGAASIATHVLLPLFILLFLYCANPLYSADSEN